MKPEKHRVRAGAVAVARGRMFLKARFAWLPGFPVNQESGIVQWMAMPRRGEQPPATLQLDRTHLHRATRTWNKLVYRFPHALLQIVEEHDQWQQGVPQLLDWLKSAIHQDEALPASLFPLNNGYSRHAIAEAHRLETAYPSLQPLLNALSWTAYLTPSELPQALEWMATNPVHLMVLLDHQPGVDGLVTALTLWRLARRDGERRVTPLLQLLGDPRIYCLPLDTTGEFLHRWTEMVGQASKFQAKAELPPRPTAQSAQALWDFVTAMAWQARGPRRHALDLFALLWPDDLLDQWQTWWAMAEPLLAQSRRTVAVAQAQRGKQEHALYREPLANLCQQLESLADLLPPEPQLQRALENLQQISAEEYGALCGQMLPALEVLPLVQDGVLMRPAFVAHWLTHAGRHSSLLTMLVREFRLFVCQHHDLPRLLEPWQMVLDSWKTSGDYKWSATDVILDELPDPRLWPRCFEALAACRRAYAGELNEQSVERIAKLIQLIPTTPEVVNAFLALAQAGIHDTYENHALLPCALRLNDGGDRLSAIASALQSAHAQNGLSFAAVQAVADWLHTTPWADYVATLLLKGEQAEIVLLGEKLLTLRALGQTVAPPTPALPVAPPTWITQYPAALQDPLLRLAAIAPAAEETAGRLLDKTFPNPAKLQTEIDVITGLLREQPNDCHLARRLESLHSRLQAPTPISAARLQRLADKIVQASERIQLQQWQQTLVAALEHQLTLLLGVSEPPAWLLEPRQLAVIAALVQLSGAMRTLGIRLLRLRCGPPPWTLLDDPANQAYLARLRRLGVNPAPWLEPPTPRLYTGQNGREVWVSFEADPLEIFQMGAHFKTCLSPGEFNFFSVFANAADINKQVVHARDERGNVVGRCLLALTDQGGLLTFEPYCHDPALGFGAIMGQVVTDLANRMGTTVAERGAVPTIVATRWYDDGPRDLCGHFAFLEGNSAFRQNLATIKLENFVPALEAAFAPLPLNAMTLLPVLKLHELQKRAELIIPLLPYVEQSKGIPDAILLHVATVAHAAGEEGFARRILRNHAAPYLTGLYRQYIYFPWSYVQLLAELEPSLALRFLRQTRPKGVSQDEEEVDGNRLTYLAQAHEALGRPVRAARLRTRIGRG